MSQQKSTFKLNIILRKEFLNLLKQSLIGQILKIKKQLYSML